MDIDKFIEELIPNTLRSLAQSNQFIVVGTRALNAYLANSFVKSIATVDWDIAYFGNLRDMFKFGLKIKNYLENKGYKINLIKNVGTGEDVFDIFSFHSRPW